MYKRQVRRYSAADSTLIQAEVYDYENGSLTEVKNPMNQTPYLAYHDTGRLEQITNLNCAAEHIYTLTYGENALTVTSPLGESIYMTLTPWGGSAQTTDALGNTVITRYYTTADGMEEATEPNYVRVEKTCLLYTSRCV